MARSALVPALAVATLVACIGRPRRNGGDDDDLDRDAGVGDASAPAPPSADLFDRSVVREIEIEIPPESWTAIDAEAVHPICFPTQRNYYSATLRVDDQVFEGVGLRVRGNNTATTLDRKPGLKINLEWDDPAVPGCPDRRRLYGQKRINLLNMLQDPSFVRIPLATDLFRAVNVPAPRAAYAHVTVNGEDWGTFVNLENIDRQFLGRWFADDDGMMYESGCFCDLVPANVPPEGADESWSCFEREFGPSACSTPSADADPTDWELLRELTARIEALPAGDFYPAIEEFFDFDQFLSTWAMSAFLGAGDGYLQNVNSYRVYHDPETDRWSMIQHGAFDGVFRRYLETCDGGILGGGFDFPIFLTGPVLTTRCLAEQDCQDAYAARMQEVIATFESMQMADRARELHTMVWPLMQQDPRYTFSCDGFLFYDDADFASHFDDYVLPWLAARPAIVRAELAFRGYR